MPVDMEMIDAMMEETEEFYSDVSDQAEANFKHAEFKSYPRSVTTSYRRDSEVTDRLYDKCLEAYEALQNADEITKARVTRLQKAHDAFFTATMVLDESNAMFAAYLDEGVATKAAAVLEVLTLLIKAHEKRLEDMADEFPEIEKLIKKAKKEVTQAEIQKGLNTALSVIGLCIPSVGGAKGILAGLSLAGGKLTMDEMLGPKGPTEASAMKTAATEYMSIAEEVGEVGSKLTGILSGVDSWVSDGKEVDEAKKVLRSLKKKLEQAQKTFGILQRALDGSEKELVRLAIGLEKAVTAANAARSRFTAHEATRYDLLADLEAA